MSTRQEYGDRIRLVVPMLFPGPVGQSSKEEKDLGRGKTKIQFDLKPEELESFLNDYIIRQDEAKEILATKICTHFNRIKFSELTGVKTGTTGWATSRTISS